MENNIDNNMDDHWWGACISLVIIIVFGFSPMIFGTNQINIYSKRDVKRKNKSSDETNSDQSSASAKSSKPLIIGICGCSGSGKTYVCDKITEYIHDSIDHKEDNRLVTILGLDNYYKGGDTNTNYDVPEAIDEQLFIEHLKMLISGKTIISPVYNFKTHQREKNKYIEIKSSPLIIVEGILIFTFENIRSLCDLRVFIDTNDATRIFRRVTRDINVRGRTIEEIQHRYQTHVADSQIQHILPSSRFADLRIKNETGNYTGLNVLLIYLESKLRQLLK